MFFARMFVQRCGGSALEKRLPQPRRGDLQQPRASPWVNEQEEANKPCRGGINEGASRPFRASTRSPDRCPRAMPWAVVSRPLRAQGGESLWLRPKTALVPGGDSPITLSPGGRTQPSLALRAKQQEGAGVPGAKAPGNA